MQTMAQALAGRIRHQIKDGEAVLKAGGMGTDSDRTDAVFGSPQDVLTVRGNVSDVALTNWLWALDLEAAGVIGELGHLKAPRPISISDAVAFLGPRDTDSAQEAMLRLADINSMLAHKTIVLSDADLNKTVNMTFKGPVPVRDLMFVVIEHGALHIGQAWGILKGSGLVK